MALAAKACERPPHRLPFHAMSEPAPAEPTPFEKFRDFARRIIAVPKSEADRQEEEWRKQRPKATEQKKRAAQH